MSICTYMYIGSVSMQERSDSWKQVNDEFSYIALYNIYNYIIIIYSLVYDVFYALY